MVIKFDYKDEKRTIQAGVYEAKVQNVTIDYSPGGTKFINVSLIIRRDVEQACKGLMICYPIWTTKKDGVETVEGFVKFGLMNMCRALNMPEEIEVDSVEDLMEQWIGGLVRITVKKDNYAEITKIETSQVPDDDTCPF